MSAIVDVIKISEKEIEERIADLKTGFEDFSRKIGKEADPEVLRTWVIDTLVERELMTKMAAATQPVPSEKRIEQELLANKELYAELPESEQIAEACINMQIRRLTRQIRKGAKLPQESDLFTYYKANKEEFTFGDIPILTRISRITLSPESRIENYMLLMNLRNKLEDDVENLLWEAATVKLSDTFSQDDGIVSFELYHALPADKKAQLKALAKGEISEVLELQPGILSLVKSHGQSEVTLMPFATVKEFIMQKLSNEIFEQELDKWYADQRAKFTVVIE